MATYNESVAGSISVSGVGKPNRYAATLSAAMGFIGMAKKVFGLGEPLQVPRSSDELEMRRFFEQICKYFSYTQGVGTPLGGVTPRWKNDTYLDTSKSEWYLSTGTSAADWLKITP